jgi:Nitrogen regulatory protein PII
MKKLEIVIRPEKFEDLKTILNESNVHGIMLTNIMGYGNQKGYVQIYRGTETYVNLLPKLKIETVVTPEVAEIIINRVTKEISTGNYGDGKIFVYEVEDVVRIRTGERGKEALQ